jgi:hypothetical protein
MKRNVLITGILATALVFGLVVMSCGGDDEEDPPAPSLPPLSEPATGQEKIEYKDVSITGLPDSVASYKNEGQGYTFSVTGGKMTLTLTTPTSTEAVNAENLRDNTWIFGDKEPIKVDGSANFTTVSSFYGQDGNVRVERNKYDTDEKTYQNGTQITYFYVSADVTISQAACTDTGTNTNMDGTTSTYTVKYSTTSLSLKKGWNLVQIDYSQTLSGGTVAAKIASADVPWSVRDNN